VDGKVVFKESRGASVTVEKRDEFHNSLAHKLSPYNRDQITIETTIVKFDGLEEAIILERDYHRHSPYDVIVSSFAGLLASVVQLVPIFQGGSFLLVTSQDLLHAAEHNGKRLSGNSLCVSGNRDSSRSADWSQRYLDYCSVHKLN